MIPEEAVMLYAVSSILLQDMREVKPRHHANTHHAPRTAMLQAPEAELVRRRWFPGAAQGMTPGRRPNLPLPSGTAPGLLLAAHTCRCLRPSKPSATHCYAPGPKATNNDSSCLSRQAVSGCAATA